MAEDRYIRIAPTAPPLAPACTLIEAGSETTPAGHIFPERRIAAAAIIATAAGAASALVNGREILHRPGTLLAVASGFSLKERSDARSSWSARWCLIEGPWATEMSAALAAQPGGVLVVARAPRPWRQALTDLHERLGFPGRGNEWQAMACLGGLLAAIAREAGRADRPDAPLAERLRCLLDEAPERDWTIAEVAAELRLSRNAFAHRFSAETGEPPARFLRRRRCEHARLLLERGLSVREAADKLGFADQFQFSRCYRTVMGQPPSAAKAAGGLRG
jgi:AraC-like DNA-binding protein